MRGGGEGFSEGCLGRDSPAHCPHCGGLLERRRTLERQTLMYELGTCANVARSLSDRGSQARPFSPARRPRSARGSLAGSSRCRAVGTGAAEAGSDTGAACRASPARLRLQVPHLRDDHYGHRTSRLRPEVSADVRRTLSSGEATVGETLCANAATAARPANARRHAVAAEAHDPHTVVRPDKSTRAAAGRLPLRQRGLPLGLVLVL